MSRYGPTKITPEISQFIVKRGIRGKTGSAIVQEINDTFGVRVSVNAVNRVKRINRDYIGRHIHMQWQEAGILEDFATLEKRLAAYQKIVDTELAKANPNNRTILRAVAAAGHDVNTTYRLVLRMKEARPEDRQNSPGQRHPGNNLQ
jgi:hypothetical protein